MTVSPTKRQRDLLSYLERCISDPVGPSFVEMRDAIGLESVSGISRLLDGLEERGHIRRLHNRARAIEVIKPITIHGEHYHWIPKTRAVG